MLVQGLHLDVSTKFADLGLAIQQDVVWADDCRLICSCFDTGCGQRYMLLSCLIGSTHSVFLGMLDCLFRARLVLLLQESELICLVGEGP